MTLLPRSTSGAPGTTALLDRLAAEGLECHSLMVVRRGQVVAETWWTPYAADRPHLLYSLTKSFTAMAVGIAVGDGLLSVDQRIVDLLPDHIPNPVSDQAAALTVHDLLTMTVGRDEDSLDAAWILEPTDLTKGFLRLGFDGTVGHTYDNATTYVLARIVEQVTGIALPEFLNARLFQPLGIAEAEWDRVATGTAFGFHGLHLTTESIAAFGELLLRDGRWHDRQLIPAGWISQATRRHVGTVPLPNWPENPDFQSGYGYQLWISRHGYFGHGSWGQYCVVVPEHELVIAFTGTIERSDVLPGLFFEYLLDEAGAPEERVRSLSLRPVEGAADRRTVEATIDASAVGSAVEDGTPVTVAPVEDGWRLTLGGIQVDVGHQEWRESSPLGRPVVATGAWQGDVFVADVYVITTPHRVRVTVGAAVATATWNVVPLTTSDLELHLRHPLMTRPDVA